jgi:hypothetical protein
MPPLLGLPELPEDEDCESSLHAALTASANAASRSGLVQAGSLVAKLVFMVWASGQRCAVTAARRAKLAYPAWSDIGRPEFRWIRLLARL